jgi:sucrose phosphorylase
MKGTVDGPDEWQFERFIASQTIMMGLEGIPAFYVHSLLGTGNDHEGVEKTGHNRAINRKRWDYEELRGLLDDPDTTHARVLAELKRRIILRAGQTAFHPNATQFTLQFGDKLFGFWRQSLDRDQSIFAIHNVTNEEISIPAVSINLITGMAWKDLLSGEAIDPARGDIIFAPYQCRWISNRG